MPKVIKRFRIYISDTYSNIGYMRLWLIVVLVMEMIVMAMIMVVMVVRQNLATRSNTILSDGRFARFFYYRRRQDWLTEGSPSISAVIRSSRLMRSKKPAIRSGTSTAIAAAAVTTTVAASTTAIGTVIAVATTAATATLARSLWS